MKTTYSGILEGARPIPTEKECEMIHVIRTNLLRRGKGTEDSPIRRVTQFYSLDGELLAENDPVNEDGERVHKMALKLGAMYEGVKKVVQELQAEEQRHPRPKDRVVAGTICRLMDILDAAVMRTGTDV
ncbi:MAG: hypothetical protein WC551_10400 [Patescibacteria group bacterium]